MALIELKIEHGMVERAVKALEGIRHDIHEYLFPSPMARVLASRPKQPEDLIEFDDEAEWQKDQEEERRRELGLEPRDEQPR